MLLGLVLLLAGTLAACQAQSETGRLPERSPSHARAAESIAPDSSDRSYVGSKVCSACHAEAYEAWQSTSHSYTVMSGDEARRAGFPLPTTTARSTLKSWSDVSYVIGGRERITYADASGNVQSESYHHRIGDWDGFPSLPMTSCGPCHFTGYGSGAAHPEDKALPGPWAERSIGCEACHGPGSRHVTSYDAKDIETDASSRSCGICHTAVGRVLPEDEWHTTHDLVQTWNRDPHVSGGQFHSQTGSCARCHAPQSAGALDDERADGRPVFAEEKKNITCVGCHDPHDITSSAYSRRSVTLAPPLAANLHAYLGDDDDFTTSDFAAYSASEEQCIHCHRGADRIELDHAQASCIDCHNTFRANRSPESRIDHDANRPRLSCRQCHRDAEYLMSIVFDGRAFLEPKNIHDLTNLPSGAVEAYKLRYPQLARAASRPEALDRSVELAEDELTPVDIEMGAPDHESLSTALQQLLDRADQGDSDEAIRALSVAARRSSTRVLLEFFVAPQTEQIPKRQRYQISPQDAARVRAGVAAAPEVDRAWFEGYLALTEDAFEDARRHFRAAEAAEPHERHVSFYLAITALALEQYQEATETLQGILDADPSHNSSRVALGLTHLKRNRLLHARNELDRAIAWDHRDPVAHYYLGHTALGQRELSRAIQAYRAAVDLDPSFLEARYALARCFRLAGELAQAAEAYRELARVDPAPFEAHVSLANLYKFLSDRNAIELLHDKESRAPFSASPSQWRSRLETLENNSEHYGGLALAELAKALQLRPSDVELKRQVSEVMRRAGNLERAEAYFRWLRDNRPEEWLPLYRLGTILIQRGDYEEAAGVLEQAIRAAPAEGDAHAALGLALLATDSLDQSIDALELATVHSPFNPAVHTNLGVAYARAGELERAQASFERSLELATFPLPRVHLNHTNLALLYLRDGHREKAVEALETALHAYPDYPYANELSEALRSSDSDAEAIASYGFVINDLLERFGEVSTVVFQ